LKPLRELDARGVRVVLFDIDDTLTTAGKLTAQAYRALEALHASGRRTVAVTGRPAGFCDQLARLWPVDAVVGENGGFYFWAGEGKLHREYREPADVRARNRERLAAIGRTIAAAVPGCAIPADERYRETDLAIDYAEEVVPPLPIEAAERIAELMRAEGLHVTMSSIHVHGWYGDYDKLATVRKVLRQRFTMDADRDRAAALYIGDSPNDASMFAFFPNSVGVANVRRFAGRMPAEPNYVTSAAFGAGFAELAQHLLRS
jgi:HAD superfamily hydrolase (TIGR01484 family)